MAETAEPDDRVMQLLAELVAVGPALLAELGKLRSDSGTQFVSLARRARSNRRMIWALVVSLTLDLVLTTLLSLTMVRQNALTHRLDVAQTTTRQKTLCPLYTLFLAGDTPAARAAAKDKSQFDHAYQVIQAGYDALDCSTVVAAPAH